jgi:hypothetical protein
MKWMLVVFYCSGYVPFWGHCGIQRHQWFDTDKQCYAELDRMTEQEYAASGYCTQTK